MGLISFKINCGHCLSVTASQVRLTKFLRAWPITRRAHLDTATGPRAVPARSSHEHEQVSDDIPGRVTQRKRCEPGTARGPLFAGAPVLWWWGEDALEITGRNGKFWETAGKSGEK